MIVKKSCILEIKSIDEKKGEVTFYFATWDKDRDNDTILPDAYNKTLVENKDFIYHNLDHENVIGAPIAFGTDDKGAWCTSKLSMNTEDGLDGYNKYKDGLIKGHSQEFVVKKSKPDPKGGRIISEMELWGVTSMTKIPANADATTISIKSFSDVAMSLKRINAILDGNSTDKLSREFLVEYVNFDNLMKKNAGLSAAGIVHCQNCKMLLPPMPQMNVTIGENSNSNATDADYSQKCPNCGRFVNKSGNLINTNMETKENKKSVLSLDAVEKFHGELKGKKEDARVIGKTWSDKPIHNDPEHEGHDDFTEGEHEQAASKHLDLAKGEAKSAVDADSDKDKKMHMENAEAHIDAHAAHMKMAFKCMK